MARKNGSLPTHSVEEQLARIEVAMELTRIGKLEAIIEAQREYINTLEESNEKLKESLKAKNHYFR